jgi:hypothetical protein
MRIKLSDFFVPLLYMEFISFVGGIIMLSVDFLYGVTWFLLFSAWSIWINIFLMELLGE